MPQPVDRRQFMKIAATSLGVGALFKVSAFASPGAAQIQALRGKENGEAPTPFSFVQLSDTHVGFEGPPNPLGTKAFERAVEMINALPQAPELVLFTGDLTHDSEKPGEHADRMRLFKKIAGTLRAPLVRYVPGEHDAAWTAGLSFETRWATLLTPSTTAAFTSSLWIMCRLASLASARLRSTGSAKILRGSRRPRRSSSSRTGLCSICARTGNGSPATATRSWTRSHTTRTSRFSTATFIASTSTPRGTPLTTPRARSFSRSRIRPRACPRSLCP